MNCKTCGKELKAGAKFCNGCGTAVTAQEELQTDVAAVQPDKPQKKKTLRGVAMLAAVCVIALSALCGWLISSKLDSKDMPAGLANSDETDWTEMEPEQRDEESSAVDMLAPYARPQLLNFAVDDIVADVQPTVGSYSVAPGLANVVNLNQFYLSDDQLQMLEENMFVVYKGYESEFFEQYEMNRYGLVPNFVTVDSMMHTYHLYFSLLLNRTEKDYLASDLLSVSRSMLEYSVDQYEELKGTQWEDAACRNTAFFAVAVELLDPLAEIPSFVEDLVWQEVDQICNAVGIAESPLGNDYMDYSQFKPRGYYEGDEVLERYFHAMMWYGQVNFKQTEESLNRSAMLMTIAMDRSAKQMWEKIYTITTFFAGASDDLGYYEYAPAIVAAYGKMPDTATIVSEEAAFRDFTAIIDSMQSPAINSVPVSESTEGDILELQKGFRFMGQRFTIDAAIMQRLVYRYVGVNNQGQKRLLPDVLDVPAAMGSDMALQLLADQGEMEYAGYRENMMVLRDTLQQAPESAWTTSLYSSWLYTLKPLLDSKGDGYPAFMTSTEWELKNLETFSGSFTELKHDTVLYSKQVMAEMGGGPPEDIDDRGYVEPEPEVYRRFMLLAQQTATGLSHFGVICSEDRENLRRLEELAQKLMIISQKELREEPLTESEYELIRCYGGTLEHFWEDAVKDKAESSYLLPREIPASLVTDIGTDPNGRVLQVATGRPAHILVLVPVDGQLRIASGVVYNFYQFENDTGDRLTDTQWRQMIGEWAMPDGGFNRNTEIEKPWWTQSYWVNQ